MKKKRKKKELKENKQTKGEATGESTQVSLFWFALWVNYKIFYVAIKAATNLIPFSCMLKKFFQHEDIVLPAAFLFHCGRGMSLRVQMIQDLIKTPVLPFHIKRTQRANWIRKYLRKEMETKLALGVLFVLSLLLIEGTEGGIAQKRTLGR